MKSNIKRRALLLAPAALLGLAAVPAPAVAESPEDRYVRAVHEALRNRGLDPSDWEVLIDYDILEGRPATTVKGAAPEGQGICNSIYSRVLHSDPSLDHEIAAEQAAVVARLFRHAEEAAR